MRPVNQRYNDSVVLDASGNGSVSITMRADFVLQRTRWLVDGGTGTNQATAETFIDSQPFEGTQSGNNDQSNSGRLIGPQSTVTCEWTGGPPGGTASLFLWGVEYPAGQGIPPPATGSGPGNPILGGNTLIRDAIQSADYVPGTTGWAIFRNGSIDMNAGTFRGAVTVTSVDGSSVIIMPNSGGKIEFEPRDVAGVTKLKNGEIFSSAGAYVGGHYAFMTFNTPKISDASGTCQPVSVEILGKPTDGSVFPGFTTSNSLFEVEADIQCHGTLLVNTNAHVQGSTVLDSTLQAGGQITCNGGIVTNRFTCVMNFGTPTLTTAVVQSLTPSSFDANASGMGSLASATITIPGPFAAPSDIWDIGCVLRFATNATGQRLVRILLNGAELTSFVIPAVAGFNTTVLVQVKQKLTQGDQIQFAGFQNSGGNLALVGNGNRAWVMQELG